MSPLKGVLGLLAQLGDRTRRIPPAGLALLVLLLIVVKAGVAGVGPNFYTPLRMAAQGLPAPVNSYSSSLGWLLLNRVLGTPPATAWWAIGGVSWLVIFGLLVKATRRAGAWRRESLLLLAASPTLLVPLTMLGHYDTLTIAGLLVVAFSNTRSLVALGALLATLGNPEQALVAGVAMLLVGVGLRSAARFGGGVTITTAFLAMIVEREWFALSNMQTTRFTALDAQGILLGLRLFAGAWPLALYTCFGGCWLVLFACLAEVRTRALGWVVAGTVALPLAATVMTLDITRVFVVTSTAAAAALLRHVFTVSWSDADPPRWLAGTLVLLAVAMPSIVVLPEPNGFVRMPYNELLTYLGASINWALSR